MKLPNPRDKKGSLGSPRKNSTKKLIKAQSSLMIRTKPNKVKFKEMNPLNNKVKKVNLGSLKKSLIKNRRKKF